MRRTGIVLSIFALCACGDSTQLTPPHASARYDVTIVRALDVGTLPSLGGKVSRGNSINDRHWIAGYSNLADDQTRHAVLWRDGAGIDFARRSGLRVSEGRRAAEREAEGRTDGG